MNVSAHSWIEMYVISSQILFHLLMNIWDCALVKYLLVIVYTVLQNHIRKFIISFEEKCLTTNHRILKCLVAVNAAM